MGGQACMCIPGGGNGVVVDGGYLDGEGRVKQRVEHGLDALFVVGVWERVCVGV